MIMNHIYLLVVFLIAMGGRAYGFTLPDAESIPLHAVFAAKTVADVERIEENRAKYVELSQTCHFELKESRIPMFCYDAMAVARSLQLEISLEFQNELDELCKAQSSKTFDLSVLDRAKSREHLSGRCLQYIREQQNVVLYKAEDL